MGAAIGQILPTAIGIAISPVPIIALILMLFSRAAARNSLAFLAGWLVGLSGVTAVVLTSGVASSSGSSDGTGTGKVLIGLLFLFLAVKQWRGRPKAGEEPEMPAWMEKIDDMSAPLALGIGLLLTVANPKNLALAIAGAATIGAANLSTSDEVVTAIVFVVLASITIIVPVVGYLAAKQRAIPMLEELKSWLAVNNAAVMAVLFLVLGAKVLGDGISLLA